jgi:ribonuclease P/MRP protein subunit RPP1
LRRVTLTLTESYQNARLTALAKEYDMLAVRPIDERTLLLACNSLDCDIISLDLTQRLPFHFKYKSFAEAIKAGKRFEICYAQALVSGDPQARRNLISNATQLIRATRGRGIILSSEASQGPVGCRGPWDIINLTTLWGLSQERGHEGVTKEARGVVVMAKLKKTGWRGVIDVINPGEKPDPGPASEVHAAGKKQQHTHQPKKQGGSKQQKNQQQQQSRQNAAQQTSGQKRKADTLIDPSDGKALAQRGLHTTKHAKQ